PPRIGYWLDRAEVVLALRSSQEAAEALKIRIAFFTIAAAAVKVSAVIIDLPDFNSGISNGRAVTAEHPPGQMRDLADRRGDRIIDNQEVVVRVERQAVGIKRSFRLGWRKRQFLGKRPGPLEPLRRQHRGNRHAGMTQEGSAVPWSRQNLHGQLSIIHDHRTVRGKLSITRPPFSLSSATSGKHPRVYVDRQDAIAR